eukprot:Polyplicarium_translucidae@DN1695_c0_g1_i1.p1
MRSPSLTLLLCVVSCGGIEPSGGAGWFTVEPSSIAVSLPAGETALSSVTLTNRRPDEGMDVFVTVSNARRSVDPERGEIVTTEEPRSRRQRRRGAIPGGEEALAAAVVALEGAVPAKPSARLLVKLHEKVDSTASDKLRQLLRRGNDGNAPSDPPSDAVSSVRAMETLGMLVVEFARGTDQAVLQASIEAIGRDPLVALVEPDAVVQGAGSWNDEFVDMQWGLRAIAAEAAWDIGTRLDMKPSQSPLVLVADSGVDMEHPDFDSLIFDSRGFDFFDDDGVPSDQHGHGTHTIGTIAATTGNRVGVVGALWNPRILPCRCLGAGNTGWLSDCMQCLDLGLSSGATIANWAITIDEDRHVFAAALDIANEAGMLVVCAAGSSRKNIDEQLVYPPAYQTPNMIVVASHDILGELALTSNWGPNTVHLVAPGEEILSTWMAGSYGFMSGTSAAVAFVTSTAAAMKTVEPTLTVEDIVAEMSASVSRSTQFEATVAWGGSLNMRDAVKRAKLHSDWIRPLVRRLAIPGGESMDLEIELSAPRPGYWTSDVEIAAVYNLSQEASRSVVPVVVRSVPPGDGELEIVPLDGSRIRAISSVPAPPIRFEFRNPGTSPISVALRDIEHPSTGTVKTVPVAGIRVIVEPSGVAVVQVSCSGLAPSSATKPQLSEGRLFYEVIETGATHTVAVSCDVARVRLATSESPLRYYVPVSGGQAAVRLPVGVDDAAAVLMWTETSPREDVFGYSILMEEEGVVFVWTDLATMDEARVVASPPAVLEGCRAVVFGESLSGPIRMRVEGSIEADSENGGMARLAAYDTQLKMGDESVLRYYCDDQVLVAQWDNVQLATFQTRSRFSFQIQNYRSGDVFFFYKNMTGSSLTGNVEIGIFGSRGQELSLPYWSAAASGTPLAFRPAFAGLLASTWADVEPKTAAIDRSNGTESLRIFEGHIRNPFARGRVSLLLGAFVGGRWHRGVVEALPVDL